VIGTHSLNFRKAIRERLWLDTAKLKSYRDGHRNFSGSITPAFIILREIGKTDPT
jgi:hypothetical protein